MAPQFVVASARRTIALAGQTEKALGRANSKGVHCTRAAPSMNGCEGIHRTVLRNQE